MQKIVTNESQRIAKSEKGALQRKSGQQSFSLSYSRKPRIANLTERRSCIMAVQPLPVLSYASLPSSPPLHNRLCLVSAPDLVKSLALSQTRLSDAVRAALHTHGYEGMASAEPAALLTVATDAVATQPRDKDVPRWRLDAAVDCVIDRGVCTAGEGKGPDRSSSPSLILRVNQTVFDWLREDRKDVETRLLRGAAL